MTQLMSLDAILDDALAKRKERQEAAIPDGDIRSPFERFLDGRLDKRVAQNERNAEGRTERARQNPISAGNELGGIATGLATAGASLAAPLVRPFSGDAADFIQAESAAASAAQQQKLQENIDAGQLGDTPYVGAARQFVNESLPGAVSSVTQAAVLGATGGTPALAAGFGAASADRSFYEGRQAGLTTAEAASFASKDAVAETVPMLVFQGLGKAVPALAGVEGMFTNPKNAATVMGLVKNAGVGLAAESVEESITTVAQLTNKAASLPGSENAANWYGEDGEFLSETSPMRDALFETWKQTGMTMGLGKALQTVTNQKDKEAIQNFASSASRRTFKGLPQAVRDKVIEHFPKAAAAQPERQAAASAVIDALGSLQPTDELAAVPEQSEETPQQVQPETSQAAPGLPEPVSPVVESPIIQEPAEGVAGPVAPVAEEQSEEQIPIPEQSAAQERLPIEAEATELNRLRDLDADGLEIARQQYANVDGKYGDHLRAMVDAEIALRTESVSESQAENEIPSAPTENFAADSSRSVPQPELVDELPPALAEVPPTDITQSVSQPGTEGIAPVQPLAETGSMPGEQQETAVLQPPVVEPEQPAAPTQEELVALTRPELQQMAKDAGLRVAGKSKPVMADAIIAARETTDEQLAEPDVSVQSTGQPVVSTEPEIFDTSPVGEAQPTLEELTALTRPELQKIAMDAGVKGVSDKKKEIIADAVIAARQPVGAVESPVVEPAIEQPEPAETNKEKSVRLAKEKPAITFDGLPGRVIGGEAGPRVRLRMDDGREFAINARRVKEVTQVPELPTDQSIPVTEPATEERATLQTGQPETDSLSLEAVPDVSEGLADRPLDQTAATSEAEQQTESSTAEPAPRVAGQKISEVKKRVLQPRYRQWLDTLPEDGVVPPNHEFMAWATSNPAAAQEQPAAPESEPAVEPSDVTIEEPSVATPEQETPDVEEPIPVDLSQKTVKELRQLARDAGLKGLSAKKKSVLVQELTAAQAAEPESQQLPDETESTSPVRVSDTGTDGPGRFQVLARDDEGEFELDVFPTQGEADEFAAAEQDARAATAQMKSAIKPARKGKADDSPAISKGVNPLNATLDVPAGITPRSFAAQETESPKGTRLVNRISTDVRDGGTNVGMRSIVDHLNDAAHTVMLTGRTQTTAKNPAHFSGDDAKRGVYGPAIVRSRSGMGRKAFVF